MMQEFDYSDFLSNIGIEKGDILDVASDLFSIAYYCRENHLRFEPKHLLEALKKQVGENGAVMIRTFTWDFCKGKDFDIRKSPSRVGTLGNIAMKDGSFQRTRHPIYSWMVWGKWKKELCQLNNKEAFSDESPFAFLYEHDGKQLDIGDLKAPAETQVHFAEWLAKIPYRKEKTFRGGYIDFDGKRTIREYSMYVRPLNVTVTGAEYAVLQRGLIEEGILHGDSYKGVLHRRIVRLKDLTESCFKDHKENYGRKYIRIDGVKGYDRFHDWDRLDFGL